MGQTEGPSDFWTTYFPGVVIFGLGMAFTVVPLTTTVMGAVSDRQAGLASGISNSMTRLANVFANAVLGALAIVLFSQFLDAPLRSLNLSSEVRESVLEQADKLGAAQVPEEVDSELQSEIERAYHQSFIRMYQRIMQISAALAWISAIVAFFLVDNKRVLTER